MADGAGHLAGMCETKSKASKRGVQRWRPLLLVSLNHFVADGISALVYPLLPAIAADLGLGYAQVGLLHAAFKTAGAALQVPAGLLAERVGEYGLILLGNGWLALGLVGMGLAGSFGVLLATSVLAGLGGNFQHPVGTGLISRVYEGPRRGRAIGTLNFSGDVGKLVGPAVVGIVTTAWGWRVGLASAGVGGFVLVLVLGAWLWLGWPRGAATNRTLKPPDGSKPATGWGVAAPIAVFALVAIGVLDSAVRGAALTLLPFVLTGKGMTTAEVSGLFTVVFAGGAAGKFVCGWIADRLGTLPMIAITELATGLTTVAFLFVSDWGLVPLALLFGFALNGTSSVLYAALAPLVAFERRARVYGIYYTATIGASSLAPVFFGAVGDSFGLVAAFTAAALVTVVIPPLAWLQREHLREQF